MSCLITTFLSFPFEQTYYYSIQILGSSKNLCSFCNIYYIYCFCNSNQRLCNQNSEIPGTASSVVLAFSQSVFTIIRVIKNGLVIIIVLTILLRGLALLQNKRAYHYCPLNKKKRKYIIKIEGEYNVQLKNSQQIREIE